MKLTRLFFILGFFIFIGGGTQFLIMLRSAEGFSNLEGDLPSQAIYALVYLVSFVLLLFSKHTSSFSIFRNIWFWVLLAWTCLSVVWSGAPNVTIRHIIAILGPSLFSILLVKFFDIEEYVLLLAISLLITVVASYLVVLFLPNIGISHVVGSEWRGIFTHKNHLGKAASLAVLIFSYLLLSKHKGKWWWIFGIIASAGLLVGGQSAAAIIITLLVEGILVLFFVMDRAPRLVLALALTLLVFARFIPMLSTEQILATFGKEETLTGRTQLWDFSINMAMKKPLLGYGYGAFWLGANGPSAQIGPDSPMDMDVTHSHNGIIEVVLDLGLIGLLFALLAYLVAIGNTLQPFIRQAFTFRNSLFLLLLLWILPYNITEQALLLRNSIFWVLFSSVIFYQAKHELVPA